MSCCSYMTGDCRDRHQLIRTDEVTLQRDGWGLVNISYSFEMGGRGDMGRVLIKMPRGRRGEGPLAAVQLGTGWRSALLSAECDTQRMMDSEGLVLGSDGWRSVNIDAVSSTTLCLSRCSIYSANSGDRACTSVINSSAFAIG